MLLEGALALGRGFDFKSHKSRCLNGLVPAGCLKTLRGLPHSEGRSIPSFEMVMRFLKAYMVDIGEFLTETGYVPPNEAGSFVLQFY